MLRSISRTRSPSQSRSERGIATLRVFHEGVFPLCGIYEEAVIGGYQVGVTQETMIVVQGGNTGVPQLYRLSPKSCYARHMGPINLEIAEKFDEATPGTSFFLRNQKLMRLERDQVARAVFVNAVWYGQKASDPDHLTVGMRAPQIPLNARMHRFSFFVSAPAPDQNRRFAGWMPNIYDTDGEDTPRP